MLRNAVGFFGNGDADDSGVAASGELAAPAQQELRGFFFFGGEPALLCKETEAEVEPAGSKTDNKLT